MADIAITPANVVVDTTTQYNWGILGETITAGLFLYLKTSDGKWYKADCTAIDKAGQTDIRLALTGGTANQPVALLTNGQSVSVGTVLATGKSYVLSSTAGGGKMFLPAELVSTNFYTTLGYATSTSVFRFLPIPTNLAIA